MAGKVEKKTGSRKKGGGGDRAWPVLGPWDEQGARGKGPPEEKLNFFAPTQGEGGDRGKMKRKRKLGEGEVPGR